MYIRWKKRTSSSSQETHWGAHATHYYDRATGQFMKKPDHEQPLLMSAYLCQSVRVAGTPRQQAVYLASMQRTLLGNPVRRREFWADVKRHLDPLMLAIEDEERVRVKLMEVVPIATDEDINNFKQYVAAKWRMSPDLISDYSLRHYADDR